MPASDNVLGEARPGAASLGTPLEGRRASPLHALSVLWRMNPAARWASSFFPRAWLLEGPAVDGRTGLKLLFLGDPAGFNYLALRFFQDLPVYRPLGRVFIGGARGLMVRRGAGLLWAEMVSPLARLLSRFSGHHVPEMLEAVIPLQGETLKSLEEHAVVRRTRRTIEKSGWTMQITTEPAELDRFYRNYYLPSTSRKFEHHRFVLSESDMRALFKRGYLLQTREGETVLGQILMYEKNGKLQLAYGGVLEGRESLVESGVMSACYYFSVARALERGLAGVDMGRCRPFVQDGVFQHKTRWGAALSLGGLRTRGYWFIPELADPAVRRCLVRSPLIVDGKHGLEALYFFDPAATPRRAWIAAKDNGRPFRGVVMKRYIPLAGAESTDAPGSTVSPVQTAAAASGEAAPSYVRPALLSSLKPAITGGALRAASRARNFLNRRGYLDYYRRTARLAPRELRELQSAKLLEMLRHARASVPHFRALIPEVTPANAWDVLRALPQMNRHDIATNVKAYYSEAYSGRFTVVETSGTTSFPVALRVDVESIKKREAVRWRGREWWGLRRGDPYVKFWGRVSAPSFKKWVRDELFENAAPLNCYNFTPGSVEENFRATVASPALYAYGYSAAIFEMASRWRERGWSVRPGKLAAVFLTADMASEEQERVIEAVFGAPTAREYGATEFLEIAVDCPRGGFHMDADRLIVEFIKEDGSPAAPGEAGSLVITDLDNVAMPFLRYPIGDLASFTEASCGCGVTLPLMKELWGRENSYLQMSNGTKVHAGFFSRVVEDGYIAAKLPCLAWHVTQKEVDKVEVTLTEREPRPVLEKEIQAAIHVLHPTLTASFRYVDVIPFTKNGKRARFTSELPNA